MPRNVAITIGVNHYQYERSLEFAGNDAKAMQSYLQRNGFEEVILYADGEKDYQPELTNLLIGIKRISNTVRLGKEDSFWFFFSGHGGRQEGRDYLLPTYGSSQTLERSAIAIEEVVRALRRCGAGNLVLILDACRNVIPNYGKGSHQTLELVKQAGIITLFSCEPGQKSYELKDLKQGAFTYGLLQALEGEYHPSRCNAQQLSKYLRETVPNLVAEKLKSQQCPYVIAEPIEKATQMLLPVPQRVVTNIPGSSHNTDIKSLMWDAMVATQQQQWQQAEKLWEQVVIHANDPKDRQQALEQLRYVGSQQVKAPEFASPKPEAVVLKSEEKAAKTLPKSLVEELGNGVKLEMILIPKGNFLMGNTDEEVARLIKESGDDWYNCEKPLHRVEITEAFYLGKFQVTQGQWQAVMGDDNPSHFKKGDDYPVEQVSWDDCQKFLEKLNQKTGKQYRLPSEAEWEYACRAGTTRRYYFGDNAEQLGDYAWFADNSGDKRLDSAEIWRIDSANYGGRITGNNCRIHPVGQKKPNQFGLYDMYGNIWEWCEDSWEDSYKISRNQKPFVNSGAKKVIRGGSWISNPRNCRSAYRNYNTPGVRNYSVGFRVVCVP
ncbi:Sulphatase-modifying factor protein [[Leptolyngbya] sp. PCC 7376]|uniref:SUMF1/EgtB/PvdO family nonheme iron enzyme n=1 Tax=[Leptolyngbya] sp. PCC 7376 TaxID=111781 RepID=UPI00029ED6A5|nr:SUMF1/EgtB/PvdO family nonheme iron enzyme [[Leptolyngbya] sp. PCC 7376]AFY39448.1 Sulphatase-modifying factor protein [[Leptolyngbya] sp. PCC 7376]